MLTFEEFIKLPYKEQAKKYKELSSRDKFRARTSCYIKPFPRGEPSELTAEEKEIARIWEEKLTKQIED